MLSNFKVILQQDGERGGAGGGEDHSPGGSRGDGDGSQSIAGAVEGDQVVRRRRAEAVHSEEPEEGEVGEGQRRRQRRRLGTAQEVGLTARLGRKGDRSVRR